MAQISLRVDDDVKLGAEKALDAIDSSMTATADPFYSESNMRRLEKIIRDIEEGKAHFSEHELIETD